MLGNAGFFMNPSRAEALSMMPWRPPGNALNGAQTFVMAHLIFLPLALTVSMWAHQLMEHRVESRFRTCSLG
jgi:hypothetical protein